MVLFLALIGLVFALALSATPGLSGGWTWDAANGVGFAALAGLLYLSSTPRGARDLKRHEQFSYVVAALVGLHAAWFLLTDSASIEYIKLEAPWYMWAGVLALILIAALAIVSIVPTRMRAFRTYTTFKKYHRMIGMVTLILASYHILGTEFYMQANYQIVGLVLLGLWVISSRALRLTPRQATVASPTQLIVATLISSIGFVLVKSLA